ncbi:hypothetical protein B0H19DRAFT_877802, partial [Mycena capillaripes]
EQADDNLVMSTTFPTFQEKVTMSWNWTIHKRAFASADTSRWHIYGPLPAVTPQLMLGDLAVKLVPEFKDVGLWFTSVHANIFARHYTIKASKARGVANAVFGLKHRIDLLPVREGLMLYKARIDCHFTSGSELSLDTDLLVAEHVEVQHLFLHQILGLNSSILAVLFTETGLMPVRMRRLALQL